MHRRTRDACCCAGRCRWLAQASLSCSSCWGSVHANVHSLGRIERGEQASAGGCALVPLARRRTAAPQKSGAIAEKRAAWRFAIARRGSKGTRNVPLRDALPRDRAGRRHGPISARARNDGGKVDFGQRVLWSDRGRNRRTAGPRDAWRRKERKRSPVGRACQFWTWRGASGAATRRANFAAPLHSATMPDSGRFSRAMCSGGVARAVWRRVRAERRRRGGPRGVPATLAVHRCAPCFFSCAAPPGVRARRRGLRPGEPVRPCARARVCHATAMPGYALT